MAVPAIDRRLERQACDASRAVRQRDQPPSVVERRAGDIRDPLEEPGTLVQPGRGFCRPARLVRRPYAGHHERRQQDPLTDGGAPGQRVATQGECPIRVAGLQSDLGQAPLGRQEELDLPARLTEGEGVGELRGRHVEIALGHRHIAERPVGDGGAAGQPLSTMAWRARLWASAGSAPAHETTARVERMTCAQCDCSIESL